MRVAIATARQVAAEQWDEDEPLLLAALPGAEPAVWDDPAVEWDAFDVVVVRSTWDYHERRDEFVDWAEWVAGLTQLANPAPVLRWNTDKRYLGDLAAAGAPVVPTQFVAPGEEVRVPEGEVVVKPTVSAGSRYTARYRAGETAEVRAHVEALHARGRTAMVQPYQSGVDGAGETALLFMGGVYSHAIRKGPILVPGTGFVEGMFAAEDISVREPSADEREVAGAVLDAVPGGPAALLYARVDLVPGPAGSPLLLELEVTEPSLFLAYAPGSAERLARAIQAILD